MNAVAAMRDQGFGNRVGFGQRPALVVIDFVQGFTDPDSPLGADATQAIEATNRLIDAMRARGLPVVCTTIRYGDAQLADAGLWPRKIQGLRVLRAGSRQVEQDTRLHLAPGDTLLAKKFASAFFGTPLASLLQGWRVDTLLVAGCSTSGCVRATVVDACQHGLHAIVVREAVADRCPVAHAQSLLDIDLKYGDVQVLDTVVGWVAGLGAP